jgi:hypothetical protein
MKTLFLTLAMGVASLAPTTATAHSGDAPKVERPAHVRVERQAPQRYIYIGPRYYAPRPYYYVPHPYWYDRYDRDRFEFHGPLGLQIRVR